MSVLPHAPQAINAEVQRRRCCEGRFNGCLGILPALSNTISHIMSTLIYSNLQPDLMLVWQQ